MSDEKRLRIVPLSAEHTKLLFEWQNDPTSLAMSRTTEPAQWANHVRWVEAALANDKKKIEIAESNGNLIGFTRFDFGDRDELSWFIDARYRGAGHGSQIVKQALARNGNGPVWASIKPGNFPSIRICEKNGFVFQRSEDGLLVFLRATS